MRPRPVHLLHTDGALTCRGVLLEDAAKPLDRDPPLITIYLAETTCPLCLRRAREQAGAAA